jgi:hypothetical protein
MFIVEQEAGYEVRRGLVDWKVYVRDKANAAKPTR